MLCLSRRKNQGITISHPLGDIHVVVVETRGDKVRLGFEADKDVIILRDEIQRRIDSSAAHKPSA